MPNAEFRKAILPDEIPALCAFDRNAFQNYPEDVFPPQEWGRYESYWMIVEGEIVGCVAMDTTNKHELWIASTAILPDFQGQKLGERLKQWQVEYAKRNGFSRIATLMRQSNERIIRLNEKFGFTRRITQRKYHNPDEPGIEMQLQLPLPECPKCGKTLRTHRAKQCRFCFADWH